MVTPTGKPRFGSTLIFYFHRNGSGQDVLILPVHSRVAVENMAVCVSASALFIERDVQKVC